VRTSGRIVFIPLLLGLLLPLSASARLIDLEAYRFDTDLGEPPIPMHLRVDAADRDDYGYYLVQRDRPVSADWKQTLEAEGAILYGYLTEFAYLVGLTDEGRRSVEEMTETHWMGPFHPAYKISPAIGTHGFEDPRRQQDEELTLNIRVFRDLDGVADELTALGCHVLDRTDDGFSRRLLIKAGPERVEEIARIPHVWWIEERAEYRLQNETTEWVVQSNASGVTPIWDQGLYGDGEIVTIMDSGLDYNSCWFRENGNAPPGSTHRKVLHYQTYGGGVAYDGCDTGHGTHVGGTLCGDQSYINPGNYAYNGMAYKAKITVQDIGADDEWSCSLGTVDVPSSLSPAYSNSYDLGARVHSNSWGSSSNTYDSMCIDVDNAMWTHPDFLICFAAGNAGPSSGTVGSPGTAKNCVTVGATKQAPDQETMASYSSRGPAFDNRIKPTLTAPGGESPTFITSADNHPGSPPSPTCATVSSPFQGTSMATPAVAGMAINIRQYFRGGYYPKGIPGEDDPVQPSAALLKAALMSSTDDMDTWDIPNNDEGWGRILIDNVLFFEGDTRELIVEDVTPGLSTGQCWQQTYTVDDAEEPLFVTVVWTDYPGTSGSGTKLVNDLDVTLTSPGGTVYLGNTFSNGFSVPGGAADRRNVEECCRIRTTEIGEWTLSVTGYNVPHAPQAFAVTLNGGFANWPPGGFSDAGDAGSSAAAALIGASPNPFSGRTTIEYAVPSGHAGRVRLEVVDVSGRCVRRLVAKGQRGGTYRVTWDGMDDAHRPVPDGVYFAKLIAGSEVSSARVILAR